MIEITSNDSFNIVSQALEDMKKEQGEKFCLEEVNLAELKRRTGISRGKLRKMKRDGFKRKRHGCFGKNKEDLRPADSFALSAIMIKMPGWRKTEDRRTMTVYGQQRISVRDES